MQVFNNENIAALFIFLKYPFPSPVNPAFDKEM